MQQQIELSLHDTEVELVEDVVIAKRRLPATDHVRLRNLLQPVISVAEVAGGTIAAEFARPDGPRGQGCHADVDDEIEAVLRRQLLELLPGRWLGDETDPREGSGGPYCWF